MGRPALSMTEPKRALLRHAGHRALVAGGRNVARQQGPGASQEAHLDLAQSAGHRLRPRAAHPLLMAQHARSKRKPGHTAPGHGRRVARGQGQAAPGSPTPAGGDGEPLPVRCPVTGRTSPGASAGRDSPTAGRASRVALSDDRGRPSVSDPARRSRHALGNDTESARRRRDRLSSWAPRRPCGDDGSTRWARRSDRVGISGTRSPRSGRGTRGARRHAPVRQLPLPFLIVEGSPTRRVEQQVVAGGAHLPRCGLPALTRPPRGPHHESSRLGMQLDLVRQVGQLEQRLGDANPFGVPDPDDAGRGGHTYIVITPQLTGEGCRRPRCGTMGG